MEADDIYNKVEALAMHPAIRRAVEYSDAANIDEGAIEFAKFLWIRANLGDESEIFPAVPIHQFWHELLIDTRGYQQICFFLTNSRELIHHDPARTNDPWSFRSHRYTQTLKHYKAYFGEGPEFYWPSTYPPDDQDNNEDDEEEEEAGDEEDEEQIIGDPDDEEEEESAFDEEGGPTLTVSIKKHDSDKKLEISTAVTRSIAHLKNEIKKLQGTSKYLQQISFNGKILSNSSTLYEHGITEGSELDLLVKQAGTTSITIKPFYGKPFDVQADLSYTVYQLKEVVEEDHGILIEEQELTFNGKPLQNEATLQFHGLQQGSTILIVAN